MNRRIRKARRHGDDRRAEYYAEDHRVRADAREPGPLTEWDLERPVLNFKVTAIMVPQLSAGFLNSHGIIHSTTS